MTLFRKLVLGFAVLFSQQALAICYGSADNAACNSQNEDEMRRENNGYYGDGGSGGGYVPPTIITLPDSWGAVATDTISGNTVSVTQQASE